MTATPRRSDRTRSAILAAARRRFATDGYDRATIRSIAADASIDPAMVMRYYGSKEQLFAAAAEFDLRFPPLDALPRDEIGAGVVGHLLDRWEDDQTLQLLLRTGATNESAAGRMQEIFAGQLVPVIATLHPAAAPETIGVRAGLAATQILGLALCRYVLRFPPVVAMDRASIVAWLGPTLQRYLAGTAPEAMS